MVKKSHDIALKYLSYRDRSIAEVEKYLKEKECSLEDIKDTIDFLTDCRMLDDEKYCERYICYGIEKGRGPLRLERDLLGRGIPQDMIRIAIEDQFDRDRERELAMAEIVKILKRTEKQEKIGLDIAGLKDGGEKELARIARRLSSQGYHSSVIYDVINKLEKR